jgi:hypothetical protein
MDCKSETETKVFVSNGPALPEMWTPPRLYAEVSVVPYLFPRTCFRRQDSGCDESELVEAYERNI